MSRENKETKKITNTQSTALKNKNNPNKRTKKTDTSIKKTNEAADRKTSHTTQPKCCKIKFLTT